MQFPFSVFQLAKCLRPCWLAMLLSLTFAGASHAQYPWNDFPGNPPTTPRWAFEPWVWNGVTFNTFGATNLVGSYLSNNIPVGAVIIDDPWFTSYCDFTWNTGQYADPAGMVQNLRAQGVRVICWMVGMVNNTSPRNPPPLSQNPGYPYAVANNLAINNNANYSWWQGSGLGVDFSNPTAVNWFMSAATNLINMGVSGFKVDQNDTYASDPVVTSPGSIFGVTNMPRGQYSEFYYGAVTDWVRAQTNDFITFSRPASDQRTTGSNLGYEGPPSRTMTSWCGDYPGDFNGMVKQLTNVYNSAIAGYSSVGFEIGGFQTPQPTHDSLLRQVELSSLLPVMENGGAPGGETTHQPWYWDTHGFTDTISTYRYYATLHHNLVPFNFHLSVNSSLTGQPAVTQVSLTKYWHILGNSLLTWAVTSASTGSTNALTLNFPNPGSLWIDWWTNSHTIYGGLTSNLTYNIDYAPIYVRAGSIIPVNVDSSVSGLGDVTSSNMDTVLMYPYGTNQFVYHRPLGEAVAYEDVTLGVTEGSNGLVQVSSPASRSWILKIVSFAAPTNVTGADSWSYSSASNLLTLVKTGAVFNVTVKPLSGYLTVTPPPPVIPTNGNTTWIGGGANANWQTTNNWTGQNNPVIAGDTLLFDGAARLNNTNDFAALTSFAGLTFNASAGAFTLSGNSVDLAGGITDNSASLETINLPVQFDTGQIIAVTNPTGTLAIGGVISGAIGLTKTGPGTLVYSGANSYSGATTVAGGAISLANGGALTPAGNGTGSARVIIGSASGSAAAFYQSGGTFTSSAGGGGNVQVGGATGAYGYYNLSGGNLTIANTTGNGAEMNVGGTSGGPGTFAQFDMSGGTVTIGQTANQDAYFMPCRGTGESAVMNLTGGSLTIFNGTKEDNGSGYSGNWNTPDTNVTTIGGTALLQSLSASVKLNQRNNAANVSVMNLNGGTFQAMGFYASGNAAAVVNFNGGTLMAGTNANGNFLGNVASVFDYSNGATINDNGNAITINQPISAVTGNGVATIPVATGGAGYVMPPQAAISDSTGTGATAYATVSGGQVTGIVVTCPGRNYTAPTVTLAGGGFTTAATLSPATVLANASGGLAKQGSGTLTLTGACTYTGTTLISAGTLALTNNGSITSSTNVNVAFGAILDVSKTTSGALTLTSGQTLTGSGAVNGNVTNLPGSILAPGGPSTAGTLTVTNVVTLGGNTIMLLNNAGSSSKLVATNINYGGTLIVSNIGPAYAAGNSFTLFQAVGYSGAFANLSPATPGPGMSWNTNALITSGVLSVAAAPLSWLKFTASPVVSGANLVISATNTGSGTVYMYTSTNVANPLDTWTPIWTNVLIGNGNFTTNLVNAVNPMLNQQFYILGNTNH